MELLELLIGVIIIQLTLVIRLLYTRCDQRNSVAIPERNELTEHVERVRTEAADSTSFNGSQDIFEFSDNSWSSEF